MNIITIRCTQSVVHGETMRISMRHWHVRETGVWRAATIALTWVLSIAYIINACECAGARHGIRGVVRSASRGWLLLSTVHTSAAAGPQSEGEAGHRQIRVARPLQPAPKQTAHRAILVSRVISRKWPRDEPQPEARGRLPPIAREPDWWSIEILPYFLTRALHLQ